ncbi:hypothetical protein [Microcoleus sp. S13_C5]|uniref:hypothetical protein n=1 Tax=Microcoleus sp. S13_C5 TaxID=3055411 RepID=UPI002FD4BBF5
MAEPMRSRRRIEHLKKLAYDCNLTNEQARQHGKLTATATWEKLLLAHGLEFDRKPAEITPAPVNQHQSINLFEWIDWGQAFALALASVGFAVCLLSLWPRINPLNLLPPVRINIQIGAK